MEDHRQYKTRVTKAMRALPRDHFIEMSDSSLVLGRSIPPTNAVSEILEHAEVGADSKVLHIGTGAGYVTALLSKLAAQVISIENNPSNARFAQARFNQLGLATLRRELAMVDFSRDTGMTLLDMGMVDQVMLSEARRIARYKKLPIINVLRDKLNMEDTVLYRRLA